MKNVFDPKCFDLINILIKYFFRCLHITEFFFILFQRSFKKNYMGPHPLIKNSMKTETFFLGLVNVYNLRTKNLKQT